MKKIILSIFVTLSGIVSVNAQYYIGGSFGYNSSTTQPEEGGNVKSYSYSIAPAVGYRVNDKLDLGISVFPHLNFLKFGFSQTKTKDVNITSDFNFALDANDILPTISLMYKF